MIKLDPRNVNAHGTLGAIFDDAGSYNEAIEQYALAVSLEGDPERAAGIAELSCSPGRKYFNENNLSDALRAFNIVLEKDPDNVVALLFTGLIYSNNSELLEDAIAAFQKLLPETIQTTCLPE